jgi:peptide chain release factor 3
MSDKRLEKDIQKEIGRRRTFAIISHPDAGKTTITEKLLLYGGAIRSAGAVKGKGQSKAVTSDWMKLERERGISVSSSVLQFEYNNLHLNLLDTPGHQDFSEDTYRTLMAADSAVMMLNNAKGVEPQTKKLFAVCKLRETPIFTFINKLDRDGLEGIELMDNVEKELGIRCIPITWPIGMGSRFQGVVHLWEKKVLLFEENASHGSQRTEFKSYSLDDSQLPELLGEDVFSELQEEVELVSEVSGEWNQEQFEKGEITPTFFGSALSNFGIEPFLEMFCSWAPPPAPRQSDQGMVDPYQKDFSAFVFKIQANMDPAHRDRIAFMRVCSGVFEAGEKAHHKRLGREIRLAQPQQFMARERKFTGKAFAGDIVGIHDPGHFRIGDTLSDRKDFEFLGIPQFSPELFSKVELKNPLKRKQLQKGLKELCEEGTVQLFIDPVVGSQDPILGAVGSLQFDVLLYRLNEEYGADARLSGSPWKLARWLVGDQKKIEALKSSSKVLLVKDQADRWVGLFRTPWDLNWLKDRTKEVEFRESMQREGGEGVQVALN